MHHFFDSIDDNRFVDPFFFGNLLYNSIQLHCHIASGCCQPTPAPMCAEKEEPLKRMSESSKSARLRSERRLMLFDLALRADSAGRALLPNPIVSLISSESASPALIKFVLVIGPLNFVERESLPLAAQLVFQFDPVRAYLSE